MIGFLVGFVCGVAFTLSIFLYHELKTSVKGQ
jgi:hypothetical protein